MTAWIYYVVGINLITLIIYKIDKNRAKQHQYRISENALIGLCLLGGSIGGLLAVRIFRHKTKHVKFTVGIPLILLVQVVVCIFLYQYDMLYIF